MNIVPQLSRSKLKFNENCETHLVVSFSAPLVDWQARRLPICLMLAIDVSGSMDGGKLDAAKNSALKIIDNLKATDYCGVATFESSARLVSAPLPMTAPNKDALRARVKDIFTMGGTNFTGGMVIGLKEVNKTDIPENMLIRLIMLTDGQANEGISDDVGICNMLRQELGRATVSSFGYGAGANQDLMTSVSKIGRGNYAFIGNVDDALTAYAKELGGLLSMYARNLTIEINPEEHKMSAVSDVPMELKDKLHVISISDILSEETRNVVLSLKTKSQSQSDALFEPIAQKITVRTSYDLLKQDGSTERVSSTQDLVLEFVNPEDAQGDIDKSLDEIIGKAQMVRAQLDAEEKAKQGDYDGAVFMMNNMSADLAARGFASLASTSSKIGSKMNSSVNYTKSAGYRTSTASAGTRSYGTSSLDEEAAADMVNIGTSLSNSAQDDLVQAFVTPAPPSNPDGK